MAILSTSYVSLGAALGLCVMSVLFAKSGGVGAVPNLAPNHLNPVRAPAVCVHAGFKPSKPLSLSAGHSPAHP